MSTKNRANRKGKVAKRKASKRAQHCSFQDLEGKLSIFDDDHEGERFVLAVSESEGSPSKPVYSFSEDDFNTITSYGPSSNEPHCTMVEFIEMMVLDKRFDQLQALADTYGIDFLSMSSEYPDIRSSIPVEDRLSGASAGIFE